MLLAAATIATAVQKPAAAQDAPSTAIHTRQIIVAGNQDVEATSINNHGVIVGNVYAGITDAVSGIEIDGTNVTTLPAPYANGGPPHPKVIDDDGDIVGWALDAGPDPRLFLVKDGATVPAYEIVIAHEEGGQNFVIQPVGLTNRKDVFGTVIVSLTAPNLSFYGVPPNYSFLPQFNRFQHIDSMNNAGVVAGVSFTFSGQFEVFAGTKGHFKVLLPPGATATQGGYVNNLGVVAGSYTDSSRLQHGFTFHDGKYTLFDMPETASSVTVTAINDAGRVVGAYTTQKGGVQRAFLYNGHAVTSFGSFSNLDTVVLALNNLGEMLVDDQLEYTSTAQFRSFRASCVGAGC